MSAFSVVFSLILFFATAAMAAPAGVGKLLETPESAPASAGLGSWLDFARRQVDGYVNDPAAGSYLGTGAIVAIVIGILVVLALVVTLICCGRAQRWPAVTGGRK